jgi:hypothetical protein
MSYFFLKLHSFQKVNHASYQILTFSFKKYSKGKEKEFWTSFKKVHNFCVMQWPPKFCPKTALV